MKKIKALPLISTLLFLVGCSNSSSNTASSPEVSTPEVSTPEISTPVPSSTSAPISYPDFAFSAKAMKSEVEVGMTVEVRAIIMIEDNKCTFTSSNPSIATVTVRENGVSADVLGVSEGTVTITAVPNANPTLSASVTIKVIPVKPSLRKALQNIQELNNYTITIGQADKGKISNKTAVLVNTEEGLLYTDYYGGSLVTEDGTSYLGEKVTADGKVVYIKKKGLNYLTTDAEIVQSNAGLLTKENFRGFKDKTIEAFQVGRFYSLDAINPNWVTDQKDTSNTYVIDGEAIDDQGKPTNMQGAYIETLLWRMMDYSGYNKAFKANNDYFYFSFANQVTTTLTVTGTNTITGTLELTDGDTYMFEMSSINKTTLTDDVGIVDAFANATAGNPVTGAKLEAGITALKTNDYVRQNSIFPDHKTECQYFTYYTPTYIFHDCDLAFRDKYNRLRIDEIDEWTDVPYGYIKKADGIYKFTYDETNLTVDVQTTKEAGTDANTELAKFANYISELDAFNTDLKYAFETEEETLWNNHNTKYYTTGSREIYNELVRYYAPEDESEIIEATKSGIGVELLGDKVDKVNLTVAATPFDPLNIATDHNYGVNYFTFTKFGEGTTNRVNTLLNGNSQQG